MKKMLISTVASMMLAGTAMAGGDIAPVEEPVVPVETGAFYAGIGAGLTAITVGDVSPSFFSGKDGQDRVWNYTLVGGYEFNDYLAIEGRFTSTFAKDDEADMIGGSVFVKPQYPVFDSMKIYALLGLGYSKVTSKEGSGYAKGNDFQWGLGASYDVMDNLVLFLDYTSLATGLTIDNVDGEKLDVDALTFGVNYKF